MYNDLNVLKQMGSTTAEIALSTVGTMDTVATLIFLVVLGLFALIAVEVAK